jgi:outer membrane receptor for monomeric catechols
VKFDHRFNEQLNLRNMLRFTLVDRAAGVTPPRIAGTPVPPSLNGVNVNRNRPNRETEETILSNQTTTRLTAASKFRSKLSISCAGTKTPPA